MGKMDTGKIGASISGGWLAFHYVKGALAEFAGKAIIIIRNLTTGLGVSATIVGAPGIATIIIVCAGNRIFLDN